MVGIFSHFRMGESLDCEEMARANQLADGPKAGEEGRGCPEMSPFQRHINRLICRASLFLSAAEECSVSCAYPDT